MINIIFYETVIFIFSSKYSMMNGNFVLSVGGARGFAHLGVIKALQEFGVQINEISGVSAGAVMGAFICDGFHPEEIKEIFLRNKLKKSPNFYSWREGLFLLTDLEKTLKNNLRSKKIEQLKNPLYITVCNVQNGQKEIFQAGDLVKSLLATCSVPGIFPPVEINGNKYADGGINCNFPTAPLETKSEPIVGISVNPSFNYDKKNGLLLNLDRTINIMLRQMSESNFKNCKLFIEPDELYQFQIFENNQVQQIFSIGYNHVIKTYSKSKIKNTLK